MLVSTTIQEQTIFSHRGNHIDTEDKVIDVVSKYEDPLVVILDNVATHEECNTLIAQARDRLSRSKIGQTKETSQERTSSGMFFEENENDLINRIEKRLSDVMCIPIDHAEGLQILHYKPGQEYKPHYDYFKQSENNRISTLILYLNDVEEGGETLFPNLNLAVSPKKGMAVYFEYFYSNSKLNELTLHSGNPVVKGEKWVATQWMRRKKVR
ncbi:2OG-Fe(II) oxygenase [Pontibacillus marinus]|uniref:2OG-Fe(II) oxygenase n=1 Tax=Pontibacillus marinus BH030004 = DSM 16465 TaxID=1385511 RepID=A0A0A5GB79_9BACI|nr:2OG-Fe(II) oxygenase [Pontibacillus marinus]KGX90421.1 2OG-Fe(II) oxygenase [Pontibacillus marinus BH030004 = DSM 16465]